MDIAQAVYVTVLGMALVFLALVIVMLVTLALDRAFRAQPQKEMAAPLPAEKMDVEALEEARVAAVIAAALAVMEQESEAEALATLPESVLSLERIPQGWKAAGRITGLR